jgi:hypothetical protein
MVKDAFRISQGDRAIGLHGQTESRNSNELRNGGIPMYAAGSEFRRINST